VTQITLKDLWRPDVFPPTVRSAFGVEPKGVLQWPSRGFVKLHVCKVSYMYVRSSCLHIHTCRMWVGADQLSQLGNTLTHRSSVEISDRMAKSFPGYGTILCG
jgi:hypothetical protein